MATSTCPIILSPSRPLAQRQKRNSNQCGQQCLLQGIQALVPAVRCCAIGAARVQAATVSSFLLCRCAAPHFTPLSRPCHHCQPTQTLGMQAAIQPPKSPLHPSSPRWALPPIRDFLAAHGGWWSTGGRRKADSFTETDFHRMLWTLPRSPQPPSSLHVSLATLSASLPLSPFAPP